MATNINELKEDTLDFKDRPELVWVPVREASNLLWVDNPKIHDMQAIINSISAHGFQAIPKFDHNLKSTGGTKGAIKDGNGRIEALSIMENGGTHELPRGLAVEVGTGKWVMPILTGTDATSVAMAQAYAIDANNVGMLGGDISPEDIASQYTEGYKDILATLARADTLPISVPHNDLYQLLDGEGFQDILPEREGDPQRMPPSQGTLLEQVEITMDDPKHEVAVGDVWELGQHILICVTVFKDWEQWVPHLTPGSLFTPFPGPFVPLSIKAGLNKLVMVQPDNWIAGHIIDRYAEINGEGGIKKRD
jgi:hypothetical protein